MVPLQVALWGTDINDRIKGAKETIASNGGLIQRTKIYKGIGHHFIERGEDGPKEFLTDLSNALDSMNRKQEFRGFERWNR